MKESVKKIYDELFCRYPSLDACREEIVAAYDVICSAYKNGGCLFTCGNGGSCSDSEHIVGELMKSFRFKRKINPELSAKLCALGDTGRELADTLEGALPAVSLCSHPALTTAFMNDTEPKMTFSEQLLGLAHKGDVLLLLSTSGNSENCVYAATLARAMEVKTVAMTGENESRLSEICDVTVRVPERETYKVQECHLPIYHAICAMLEEEFFEH